MMRHIRVPRPSFVRVNPVDKSKNRLYKAVPVDFSRDYCPTLRKIHLILLNSRIFCATNCAKSRFRSAKVRCFVDISKFFPNFFAIKTYFHYFCTEKTSI